MQYIKFLRKIIYFLLMSMMISACMTQTPYTKKELNNPVSAYSYPRYSYYYNPNYNRNVKLSSPIYSRYYYQRSPYYHQNERLYPVYYYPYYFGYGTWLNAKIKRQNQH